MQKRQLGRVSRCKLKNLRYVPICLLSKSKRYFSLLQQVCRSDSQTVRDNKHQTAISNVDNWIRALLWILIYSNELLKEVSTSDCNKCMYNLYVIWKNYIQHKTKSTQERYVRYVICCMLFLLRRRKYDHDFLREDTTPIFAKIMELKHFIDQQADSLFYSNAKIDLAYAFFEYLENKGRLDIPMGGILNDGN